MWVYPSCRPERRTWEGTTTREDDVCWKSLLQFAPRGPASMSSHLRLDPSCTCSSRCRTSSESTNAFSQKESLSSGASLILVHRLALLLSSLDEKYLSTFIDRPWASIRKSLQLSRFLPARVMCTEAVFPLFLESRDLHSLTVPKLSSTWGRTLLVRLTCSESGTFGTSLHAARIFSLYEYIRCASNDCTAHRTRFHLLELSASLGVPSETSSDNSLYLLSTSFFRAAGITRLSSTVSCLPK
mmetsp:Transcript_13146/g.36951  ORF Transcript_13146/g.36951 Transcript_13146/m.36951 type:complete len:242 (-) Transcript_13146:199-924(-)